MQQAPAILPLLLPGAIYESSLNVEFIRPAMRVDKVFKILYDGKEQILHLEFETDYDKELLSRLLVYNAIYLDAVIVRANEYYSSCRESEDQKGV